MSLKFEDIERYECKDIFDFKIVEPRNNNIPFRNIQLKSKNLVPSNTGIYFLFFKKELLYIGIFSSNKSGPVDKVRWLKHIETFTMRGKDSTLAGRSQEYISARGYPYFNFKNESFMKAKGRCSSKMRALFAAKNWDSFRDATPEQILKWFTFLYQPISSSTKQSHFKKELENLEKELIQHFCPVGNKNFNHSPNYSVDDVISYLGDLQGSKLAA